MGLLATRARADEYQLLEMIFWLGEASRLRVGEWTGWSKTKLLTVVNGLIEEGYVIEGEPLRSTGGRRANTLLLNPACGCLIGVDLGATSLDVALTDLQQNVLARCSKPVDVRGGPENVMAVIRESVLGLLAERGLSGECVLGVGMGVPRPVEFATGTLTNPPIMPGWHSFSIRGAFASFLAAPMFIDNDVNLLALGELQRQRRKAHDGQADETFVVVKLGTGIGAGIVSHGELHRGANGAAGDVGHICVEPGGRACHCGNLGCLEAVAGAQALCEAAEDAAREGRSALLAKVCAEGGRITPLDITRAAAAGDVAANQIIRRAGEHIGRMLAGITNFFNPGRLLIGGGLSELGPSLLSSIRQSVYARSLALSTRRLDIDLLPEKDSAGTRGACTLAFLQLIREQRLLSTSVPASRGAAS